MLSKTTLREIKNTLGRYLAILAIIALGVGFFSGLKVTRPSMLATANDYLQEYNLYDYQLLSTLGFEDADVKNISKAENVKQAMGSICSDVLVESEKDADFVMRSSSITKGINDLHLSAGRLPVKNNECVVDGREFQASQIGDVLRLSDANTSDTSDMFRYKEYTITGIAQSPVYLNFERGSSSLGNGTVIGFFYINKDGFDTDYYTEVYVNLNTKATIYSDAYNRTVDQAKDPLTLACQQSANRRYSTVVTTAEKKLAKEQKKYNDRYAQYQNQKKSTYSQLRSAHQKIIEGGKTIKSQERIILTKQTQLEKNEKQIQDGLSQVDQNRQQLEINKPNMTPEQIAQTEQTLNATEKQLNTSLAQVKAGYAEIRAGERKIATAKRQLASSITPYDNGVAEADAKFAQAASKLEKGKTELTKAEMKIKKIKKADTYVLTRDANMGYASFENDSTIVDGIAKVFPIFFFMVAALVCMTTMTRMVDEQRTQIGVFKALGYSNGAVMGKYLFYAGSAAILGTLIGFFVGCYLFPTVIWKAYSMMYDFSSSVDFIFDWKLAIISITVSLICSMGATLISCLNDFRIMPAELIRPKAPKNGKRILLERITFIWKRVGFLYKVTFRNIFRYKKRFLMMVLGISGCTALLLTGLGVNDSVKNFINFQYDEIVTYDYSVTFSENQTLSDQQKFISESADFAKSVFFAHEGPADYVSGKTIKPVKLIVADSKKIDDFDDFIDLHTKTKAIPYPSKGEAVICEKLAVQYNLGIGDVITLRTSDMSSMKVKVSNICENYVYNYVYVSPETCTDAWGYLPDYKTAYVNAVGDTTEAVYQSSVDAQQVDGVVTTTVNNDMRQRVEKMMESLNAVILLIVLSAGALAFIVLYNLTNINITERIREIATIKVLGFYPKETAAYVFRENFILTGISALVGLVVGKIFHTFVIKQIQVDLIYFDARITPWSYVLAVLLTFVFAIIVSVVMFFKLRRINMTESLKSVE